MSIERALKEYDVTKLINRLTAYAYGRLKTVGIKDFEGKEPCDLVAEVIEKSLIGIRNWDQSKCSLQEFLFGCLKSDIDAFFKKKKYLLASDLELASQSEDEADVKKAQAIEILKSEGADSEEISVFELWAAGILRPADVSSELNIPVKNIYVITKRLERRLAKSRSQLIEIV